LNHRKARMNKWKGCWSRGIRGGLVAQQKFVKRKMGEAGNWKCRGYNFLRLDRAQNRNGETNPAHKKVLGEWEIRTTGTNKNRGQKLIRKRQRGVTNTVEWKIAEGGQGIGATGKTNFCVFPVGKEGKKKYALRRRGGGGQATGIILILIKKRAVIGKCETSLGKPLGCGEGNCNYGLRRQETAWQKTFLSRGRKSGNTVLVSEELICNNIWRQKRNS